MTNQNVAHGMKHVTCGFYFFSHFREGPDLSGDSEKVFHRSLHLLHFWITDCRTVDFVPNSSLVDVLEKFLNTEVARYVHTVYSAIPLNEKYSQVFSI